MTRKQLMHIHVLAQVDTIDGLTRFRAAGKIAQMGPDAALTATEREKVDDAVAQVSDPLMGIFARAMAEGADI